MTTFFVIAFENAALLSRQSMLSLSSAYLKTAHTGVLNKYWTHALCVYSVVISSSY